MKKFALILSVTLVLGACHYGKKEAAASLERNKEYKEKAGDQGPEINPDYVKGGAAPAAADTTAKPATDSTHQQAAH